MTFSQALLLLGCLSLAPVATSFAGAVAPELQPAGTTLLIEATVSRVIDGSTLDAQIGGVRTPVGYLGVETAALNRPCGREAFDRNRELVAGGVFLEPDSTYELDDLSRRLYYAYSPDGTSIDEALIGEGLARAVRTDATHGERLAALEAEAQAAGLGCLWANEPS
jgi:micrococcal nuclease